MKARVIQKKNLISFIEFFFSACLFFLNTSCGLDEYYTINGPSSIHCPVYTASDPVTYENRYFEFSTNGDDESAGDFNLDGTNVYYKIYSNLSTCESEYSALNTLTNSTSTAASSASSMINSYSFQKLKIEGSSSDIFVSHDGQSKSVRIRLTTYLETQDEKDFCALVTIDGTEEGVPVRYYGDRFFDFVRNSTSYSAPIPRTTSYEDDVSTSTSTDDTGYWYVTLYAVTVGHDATFTSYYSPIVHLGTLAIDPTSYDN